MKTLFRMWHQRRLRKLDMELQVQRVLIDHLQVAERAYGNSYYTDKLHEAAGRKVRIECAMVYHRSRMAE